MDEFRLLGFPVLLGAGDRPFDHTGEKKPLRLIGVSRSVRASPAAGARVSLRRPVSASPSVARRLPNVRMVLTMTSNSIVSSLAGGELGGVESDFVIVEWSDSGDSEWDWIAPLHVHHTDDEAWYVLEGSLRFRIADDIFEINPGGAVLAPKGTPHAYGNARRGQMARYLLVMTPKIRALVQALHEPEARDHAAIFRAYGSEMLG